MVDAGIGAEVVRHCSSWTLVGQIKFYGNICLYVYSIHLEQLLLYRYLIYFQQVLL